MRSERILVAGFPGAGKSSFADAVADSELGLVHIPMDHYILSIPEGISFLDWVREPSCVDWNLLREHVDVLNSGRVCFTPRPDWSSHGKRSCSGGPLSHGSGRKMNPSERGYIIAGTHVYSLGGEIGPHVKVFVATADAVIASRLEGRLVPEEEKEQVIRKHLRENLTPLRGLHRDAALVIDGSWPHEAQVAALKEYLQRKE